MKWFDITKKRYVSIMFGVLMLYAVFLKIIEPNFISLSVSPIKPISQGNSLEPKVALACNVFWGEEYLPEMLNVLDKHNSKITFFIGGSWGKRFPQLVAELAKRGHELGNHSYSHPHPNSISKEKNKEQILRTENLVNEIAGIQTKLYAPPYGEYNDVVLAAADELGYKTILWSVDTIDWQRPPANVIINRVMKKVHNGAIILIHPTESTAQALPELIERLHAAGYQISTVSDIIK